MVRIHPPVQETWVRSLGREDPLEEGMATLSGILAWRIPQRNVAGYSPRGCKELDMTEHILGLAKKKAKIKDNMQVPLIA